MEPEGVKCQLGFASFFGGKLVVEITKKRVEIELGFVQKKAGKWNGIYTPFLGKEKLETDQYSICQHLLDWESPSTFYFSEGKILVSSLYLGEKIQPS